MNKCLNLILMLSFNVFCFSQKDSFFKNYAGLSADRNFHGSGDIRGFIFSTEFSHYFKKKLNWSIELSGTIHDGFSPEFYTYNGQQIDGSVRYTVAGVQLSGHFGYSLIKEKKNEFQIKLGVLCRYQSSSLPYDVTTLYPPITNLPFPVVVFNNIGPLRTVAPGASVKVRYDYTFSKKIVIGILAGFQADTEGDNLSQLCLSTGLRF